MFNFILPKQDVDPGSTRAQLSPPAWTGGPAGEGEHLTTRNTRKNSLEEERFILAQVSEVQSMVDQLHCCGREMRQSIMVEVHGGGKLLSSWQRGSKQR